jgi:hypothetical protein
MNESNNSRASFDQAKKHGLFLRDMEESLLFSFFFFLEKLGTKFSLPTEVKI